MRIISLVAVAGCAAAPPPPAVVRGEAPATAERWIFRQLRVGTLPIATRTTFELVIDGDRASLVEIDERGRRALSLAEADRGAPWTVTARQIYRGTAAIAPGAFDLALGSEGVQALQLHCVSRTIAAAAPGAVRVPSPNRPAAPACGDHGVWEPAATTPVRAVVCAAGMADPDETDDDDDDDRLVFAPPPGLEHATVNDDCVIRGGGLRVMR